ncbi:conserved hypothetical protein [Sporisorium reilianum SRZ2]|uniref:Rrp15p-domain-containing protein n=2 Tax=Sporisorium reilianum TaxID=72558 RepID=E6ZKC0_SPORE|nr:conserved hypothetical protein [Sporisorium reilianum SRZ2]SJX60409.1 uncharacterized protein SRS1_11723 [Sporisorium reilianum f. sp. reilianum]
MAAGKFGSGGGSKMTMKVASAGTSSAARAGPSKQNAAAGKGKGNKAAASAPQNDDSDSDDAAYDDDDQISLDDDEPDTEDEIEAAKGAGSKSKKTAKRKRRATSPTSFGTALEGLLGIAPSTSADALETLEESAEEVEEEETDVKSKKKAKTAASSSKPETSAPAILSLAPHLRRSAQSTTLSARAARIALEQKRRREERCHVKDVIGGWGPPGVLPALEDEDGNVIETYPTAADDAERLQEFASQGGTQSYERKLRKVAQRGVVKLFNAIRAAQTTTEDDLHEAEAKKSAAAAGKTKTGAAAGAAPAAKKAGLASKDARLADLSKSNFLDLIKKSSKPKGSSVAAK